MNIIIEPGVEEFIRNLGEPIQEKTLMTLQLLEKYGYQIRMPLSKKVGKSLFELRVQSLLEVRIFYAFIDGSVILLHAFIKKSQKTPKKELRLAYKLLKSLT